MFASLPVLIAGQADIAVSSAELPAWPAGAASLSGAHEQRLTLLAVLSLEGGRGRRSHAPARGSCRSAAAVTYDGVVVALQANIWLAHAGTVAVLVAAALR